MVTGRVFGFVLALAFVVAPQGCAAGKCEQKLVDDATAFVKQHQSCTVDADCVVISDYCQALAGGFCGQLVMNRDGQESSQWATFDHELKDCGPDECTVCNAAVTPACHGGSCTGYGLK